MTAVELETADWQRLQSIIADFESAGGSSSIDVVLAANESLRDVLIVELVHADLEQRLRTGEIVRLENYLERFPDLAECLPELVLAEYRIRRELDPLFDGAGYSTRFPDHASTIQSLIEHECEASTLASPMAPGPRFLPAVPGYEVRRVLGRGGMGIVYEAWDGRLSRTVALKMLRHEESAESIGRLRREAATLAEFVDPNIVQIFEVGDAAGRTYLALEYVAGGSLSELIGKAPLDAIAAAKVVLALSKAVQSAHEHGVIHRDIKPGNVLLTPDGTPKLNDFGLAKQMAETSGPTETGALLGTPGYMAPEQTLGQVTPQVDLYALGAVLYECIAGRPPFRGATPLDTLALTRDCEPVALRQLQPSVPRDLETIALKCLRKSPADRYAMAADLASDLERFLGGRAIQARPVGLVEHSTKWMRRNPIPTLLACLLLLATAGILTQWYRYTESLRTERDAARQARGEAEASDREAQARAVEAQDQTTIARSERSRAEASYLAARKALGEFQSLRDDPRLAEGELEPLRKEMLKTEAEFYRHFTKIQDDSPAFRIERAKAWLDLSIILNTLGDLPGQQEALGQAKAHYRELANQQPDRTEFTHHFIHTQEAFAKLLSISGRFAESEKELIALLPITEAAVKRWPEHPEFQQRQASQLQRLGELSWSRRDGPAAIERYREALALFEPLVKARPADKLMLCDWLNAAMGLGVLQFSLRDSDGAIASFRRGLELFDAAQPAARDDPTAVNLAAQIKCEQGFVLSTLREDATAETLMADAWKSLTELHSRFPHRTTLLVPLVRVTLRYSKVIQSRGRIAEAVEKLEACLPLARRMVAAAPTDGLSAEVLATAFRQYADQSFGMPRTSQRQVLLDQNLAEAEKLLKQFPENRKIAQHLGQLLGHKADEHRKAGDFDAMLQRIERSVALDPSPSSRYMRAIAWSRTGRVTDAAAEAATLAKGPPTFEPFQIALLYSILAREARQKESKLADEYLDRAVAALKESTAKTLASPQRLTLLKESDDFAALRERSELKEFLSKAPPGK